MEKTWMYMVECAIESEINRYTTANPADIYFDEGNLCGARTCAEEGSVYNEGKCKDSTTKEDVYKRTHERTGRTLFGFRASHRFD